jgi:hypothetical protein
LFSYYFYFTEWSETKMPTSVDLFLDRKQSGLWEFRVF